MDHVRSILVAVKDPGASQQRGVAKAAQLARALGAELTLFQAVPAPSHAEELTGASHRSSDSDHSILECQAGLLERIALRLRRRGLRVSAAVQWDHPVYSAILRAAAEAHADLIVAEAHPHGHHGAGLRRLTDWELVRHGPVPVLLVKRPELYRRPRVLLALDPDHTFGKPLSLDAEILALGSAVTQAVHGTLHAVYAFAPIDPRMVSDGVVSAQAVAKIQRDNEAIAAEKLAKAVGEVGIPTVNQHVVGRHVPDAIEQVAAQSHSAIVVVGAVARSGLTSVLIGNTAERLFDSLTCDLLVIKPREPAQRPQRATRPTEFPTVPVIPGM
jgi:universal stress protein E